MSHLISRYQHLLWKLLPKQTENVAGHEIKYVVVPRYLLISGSEAKSRFVDAMCLTHRSTQSLMIMISSKRYREELLKYTLFHEHLEAMAFLDFPIQGYDLTWAKTELELASAEVKQDCPDIEERIITAIKNKQGDDQEHFFALVLELALMKKELEREKYLQQLNYALRERF